MIFKFFLSVRSLYQVMKKETDGCWIMRLFRTFNCRREVWDGSLNSQYINGHSEIWPRPPLSPRTPDVYSVLAERLFRVDWSQSFQLNAVFASLTPDEIGVMLEIAAAFADEPGELSLCLAEQVEIAEQRIIRDAIMGKRAGCA